MWGVAVNVLPSQKTTLSAVNGNTFCLRSLIAIRCGATNQLFWPLKNSFIQLWARLTPSEFPHLRFRQRRTTTAKISDASKAFLFRKLFTMHWSDLDVSLHEGKDQNVWQFLQNRIKTKSGEKCLIGWKSGASGWTLRNCYCLQRITVWWLSFYERNRLCKMRKIEAGPIYQRLWKEFSHTKTVLGYEGIKTGVPPNFTYLKLTNALIRAANSSSFCSETQVEKFLKHLTCPNNSASFLPPRGKL